MKTEKLQKLFEGHSKILGIVATILFVTIFSNSAYGELETITASNEQINLFISTDDELNFVALDNEIGHSIHFDSEIKHYKSGGFRLKNLESGILIFGHYIDAQKIKLTVITSESIHRLIGFMENLNDISVEQTENQTAKPERIEPKSSIGSDVSKWNVPTTGRPDLKDSMLLTIKADRISSMYLGDNFDKTFKVYDARHNKPLVGANVNLEISRDGIIFKKLDKISEQAGLVRMQVNDLSYPEFYPNFCYDIKVIANYGNNTRIWTDDFVMYYSGVWNPSFGWMEQSRYDYLPDSFSQEPRESIRSDEHCN